MPDPVIARDFAHRYYQSGRKATGNGICYQDNDTGAWEDSSFEKRVGQDLLFHKDKKPEFDKNDLNEEKAEMRKHARCKKDKLPLFCLAKRGEDGTPEKELWMTGRAVGADPSVVPVKGSHKVTWTDAWSNIDLESHFYGNAYENRILLKDPATARRFKWTTKKSDLCRIEMDPDNPAHPTLFGPDGEKVLYFAHENMRVIGGEWDGRWLDEPRWSLGVEDGFTTLVLDILDVKIGEAFEKGATAIEIGRGSSAHSGTISVSETWNDGDTMVGHTTINSCTLTIAEGATIGVTGNYKLKMDNAGAEMIAVGTIGDNCVFESQDGSPAAGDWIGIQWNSDAANTSNLQYFTVKHSQLALVLDRDGGTFQDITCEAVDSGLSPVPVILKRTTADTSTITRLTIGASCNEYEVEVQAGHIIIQDSSMRGRTTSNGGTFLVRRSVLNGRGAAVAGIRFANAGSTVESSLIFDYAGSGIIATNVTGTATNCTVSDCVGGVTGNLASGVLTCTNVIAWGNTTDIVEVSGGSVIFDHGDYSTTVGSPTITNSITLDPLFTDAASDDYSLRADSPCINTGTSVGAAPTDINGVAYPNANPEMGAHSYTFPAPSRLEYAMTPTGPRSAWPSQRRKHGGGMLARALIERRD